MGVPAVLAPAGVSVSHPKERRDGHAAIQYPMLAERRSGAAWPDGQVGFHRHIALSRAWASAFRVEWTIEDHLRDNPAAVVQMYIRIIGGTLCVLRHVGVALSEDVELRGRPSSLSLAHARWKQRRIHRFFRGDLTRLIALPTSEEESVGRLDELDLSLELPKKEAKKRLKQEQKRLLAHRLRLAGLRGDEIGPPVCIVFEGWDASGKGGAIKRLVKELDPRHVRVRSFSAPTDDEQRHHWLWRFWPVLPGWGGMAVFDRSWYGRVLVERVEGFAEHDAWQRAFTEIREFESMLIAEGMVLVKFWVHISDEEQLRRFKARKKDSLKSWKLTDEDWRNREKRDAYTEAVEEMLDRTSTSQSPWHLIEGDSKRFARLRVVETVNQAIEAAIGGGTNAVGS
jgi:polyphosphate kinase 2 (PPK2 family)